MYLCNFDKKISTRKNKVAQSDVSKQVQTGYPGKNIKQTLNPEWKAGAQNTPAQMTG